MSSGMNRCMVFTTHAYFNVYGKMPSWNLLSPFSLCLGKNRRSDWWNLFTDLTGCKGGVSMYTYLQLEACTNQFRYNIIYIRDCNLRKKTDKQNYDYLSHRIIQTLIQFIYAQWYVIRLTNTLTFKILSRQPKIYFFTQKSTILINIKCT